MMNPGEQSDPTFIRTLLARWLPPEDYDLWRAAAYRFHTLVVEQWRAQRLFFLGDAAHMTPPFLAQGMCQGIRDAANLTWKLALHRRGDTDESTLDTYQHEREPHVRQVTLTAKRFGETTCERDEAAAGERDAVLLAELAAHPAGTIRQSLIPGLQAGSLAPAELPARGEILPQPRVTDRRGRTDLLDEFTGAGFRLVLRRDAGRAVVEAALGAHLGCGGPPIHLVDLAEDTEKDDVLDEWLRRESCTAGLVRPDHYAFGGARTAGEINDLPADLRRRFRPVPASVTQADGVAGKAYSGRASAIRCRARAGSRRPQRRSDTRHGEPARGRRP
jgi:3-(3-hydroxy-phenyl)propionate hydroxylase